MQAVGRIRCGGAPCRRTTPLGKTASARPLGLKSFTKRLSPTLILSTAPFDASRRFRVGGSVPASGTLNVYSSVPANYYPAINHPRKIFTPWASCVSMSRCRTRCGSTPLPRLVPQTVTRLTFLPVFGLRMVLMCTRPKSMFL